MIGMVIVGVCLLAVSVVCFTEFLLAPVTKQHPHCPSVYSIYCITPRNF